MKKLGMLVALLGLITVCTAYLAHSQGKSKTPTLTTDDVGPQGRAGASPTQGAESGAYRNQTLSKDGPVSVAFFELFQKGPITVAPVDPGTVLPLPAGYAHFNGIVYDVRTEAVGVGPTKVLFNVKTVADPAQFNNLRVLHLENDSIDPERLRWIDRTILTPDAQAPDFGARTLYARVEQLGKFVLASGNQPLASKPPMTDLAIICTASPDPVIANHELTYTIKVSNSGSQSASAVVTNTKLSVSLDFVSAKASQGICKGAYDTVVCNIGTLNAGETATIRLVVKTNSTDQILRPQGTKLFTTTVLGGDVFDTNLKNNRVETTTTLLPHSALAPR